MTTLTSEQIEFLVRQGIPLSQVFDATGISASIYKPQMQKLGMVVAFGVTPCSAAGHSLRTRYGHCVQCGTHNLAFLQRYDNTGDVYVAQSRRIGLIKLGTADDADARERSLNYFGYGGSDDWIIKHIQRCEKAGRVEFTAHQSLHKYCVSRSYEKQGRIVNCAELFSCKVAVAESAIANAIRQLNQSE